MSQTPFTRNKDELLAQLIPLLQEIKDMTTGTEFEQWLNTTYGVESDLYKDVSRRIRLAVKEGWAARNRNRRAALSSLTTRFAHRRNFLLRHHSRADG